MATENSYSKREARLVDPNWGKEYNCCVCNARVKLNYFRQFNEELKRSQLCAKCVFWREVVREATLTQPEISIRVEGHHYSLDSEDLPRSIPRGHGGRLFFIKLFAGPIIQTTNLWYNGVIPNHFKVNLPDNALFITHQT